MIEPSQPILSHFPHNWRKQFRWQRNESLELISQRPCHFSPNTQIIIFDVQIKKHLIVLTLMFLRTIYCDRLQNKISEPPKNIEMGKFHLTHHYRRVWTKLWNFYYISLFLILYSIITHNWKVFSIAYILIIHFKRSDVENLNLSICHNDLSKIWCFKKLKKNNPLPTRPATRPIWASQAFKVTSKTHVSSELIWEVSYRNW